VVWVIGTAVGEAPAAAEVVDAGPWQALNVATAVHATSRERRAVFMPST
jgi:hypothetical protein